MAEWHKLPAEQRSRVDLLTLPMTDVDDSAAMVNALQRRAAVVVQKNLADGFGLTVAEGMWKARPVVASAVGGIRDQVADAPDSSSPTPATVRLRMPPDPAAPAVAAMTLVSRSRSWASLRKRVVTHVSEYDQVSTAASSPDPRMITRSTPASGSNSVTMHSPTR